MKRLSPMVVLLAMTLLCGCQTTSPNASPLEALKHHDRAAGTAVGATVGAITGGIIGHQRGKAREGAAIGALVGGGLGFVAGDIAARRREQFATESEFLEAEIELVREAVQVQEERNADLKKKLATMRHEADGIEARHRAGVNVVAERRNRQRELGRIIEENNQTIKRFAQSIEYLEEVLKMEHHDDSALQAKRSELERELDRLKAEYDALTRYNTEFADQYDRLAEMY